MIQAIFSVNLGKLNRKSDMIIPDLSNRRENIEKLAYLKWEAAGCPDGTHENHWLEAEAEYDSLTLDQLAPVTEDDGSACCQAVTCSKTLNFGEETEKLETCRNTKAASQ